VYGIVRRWGGHIEVKTQPGEGTTFIVYLKRERGVSLEKKSASVPREGILPGNETILIVEDQDAVREIAASVLEKAGYLVMKAEDGSEALRKARAHRGRIDLLLSDVVMPEMSGPEVAERLLRRHPAMKVLFMSGYAGSVVDRFKLEEAGHNVLQKPFTAHDLSRRIREMLDDEETTPAIPSTAAPAGRLAANG
jgi:CheY-like chemotaxis protein